MMIIIRKGHTVKVERYALVFECNDTPGAGFSFPCDKQGISLVTEMGREAWENLSKCLSGEYDVTPRGVKDYSYAYYEPTQGRCSCETNSVELPLRASTPNQRVGRVVVCAFSAV